MKQRIDRKYIYQSAHKTVLILIITQNTTLPRKNTQTQNTPTINKSQNKHTFKTQHETTHHILIQHSHNTLITNRNTTQNKTTHRFPERWGLTEHAVRTKQVTNMPIHHRAGIILADISHLICCVVLYCIVSYCIVTNMPIHHRASEDVYMSSLVLCCIV